MLNRISLILILVIQSLVYSQVENCRYKREIKDVSEQWHKIELPDGIFEKLSEDYSDLRVVGVTEDQDTIEVPYLFKISDKESKIETIDFKIINQSYNEKGSYFTFEVPTKEELNSINLSFEEENFDWKVRLEGSQNQQEWFTFLYDYRILPRLSCHIRVGVR